MHTKIFQAWYRLGTNLIWFLLKKKKKQTNQQTSWKYVIKGYADSFRGSTGSIPSDQEGNTERETQRKW